MNLRRGYQLEQPDIFVPWDVTWKGLQELLAGWSSARFHDGKEATLIQLASLRCASLGGLRHGMVIRFRGDRLDDFELQFPDGSLDAKGLIDFDISFPLFQQHLQETFGPPTVVREGSPGAASPEERFPECEWLIDGVYIRHAIDEHFGPVEHLTIQRPSHPPSAL